VSCRRKQDQNTNKNKPADDDSGVESTGEEGIINKKGKEMINERRGKEWE
jgi:hypothetical protein